MAASYDVNHLEDQKKSTFRIDLSNQDEIGDFIAEFNNFNKDISNRDDIFSSLFQYYDNPVDGAVGVVYYDDNKNHFVMDVQNMNGGRKVRRSRSLRKKKKVKPRKSRKQTKKHKRKTRKYRR